jgi:hypothetical protein
MVPINARMLWHHVLQILATHRKIFRPTSIMTAAANSFDFIVLLSELCKCHVHLFMSRGDNDCHEMLFFCVHQVYVAAIRRWAFSHPKRYVKLSIVACS